MKRFRVIVHGVTRMPAGSDEDGAGFYTARSVVAESTEHAAELVLMRIRNDSRGSDELKGRVLNLSLDDVFEVDASDEDAEQEGYVYYDGLAE